MKSQKQSQEVFYKERFIENFDVPRNQPVGMNFNIFEARI